MAKTGSLGTNWTGELGREEAGEEPSRRGAVWRARPGRGARLQAQLRRCGKARARRHGRVVRREEAAAQPCGGFGYGGDLGVGHGGAG